LFSKDAYNLFNAVQVLIFTKKKAKNRNTSSQLLCFAFLVFHYSTSPGYKFYRMKIHTRSCLLQIVIVGLILTLTISRNKVGMPETHKEHIYAINDIDVLRVYKEHVHDLVVNPLHFGKTESTWQKQSYSRPYLSGERNAPCGTPNATAYNREAVGLIRQELDKSDFPLNFDAARRLLRQAVAADRTCQSATLNLIILLLQDHCDADTPYMEQQARLREVEEVIGIPETIIFQKQFADIPEKIRSAKFLFWHGIYLEILYNHSVVGGAREKYATAEKLDPLLKLEHVHPTMAHEPFVVLRDPFNPGHHAIRRTLVRVLFYYEYAPALGGYPKLSLSTANQFLRDWHVAIDGAFPPFVFVLLSRLYTQSFDHAEIKATAGYKGAATHESNGDALNTWMNIRIGEFVQRLVGAPVEPTYGYTAGYLPGDWLQPHTDRMACEFTLTTLLNAYPHSAYCPLFVQRTPWPINDTWVGRFEHSTINYTDCFNARPQINQWVILRGRAKPHYRPPLAEDAKCVTFLSHFVPLKK